MSQEQSFKKVVVLNDTSGRQHHGCARVMRVLRDGLEGAGLRITATSPARHDWAKDFNFQAHLAQADLIVINGEGTLHHARPAGEALLRVVDELAARGTPIALVNALYQDNPPEWGGFLGRFSMIAARDTRSQNALAAVAPNVPLRVMPDLSLCAPGPNFGLLRDKIVFGDSVKLAQRRALLKAAARCGADVVLPMKTRDGLPWRFGPTRAALYAGYSGHLGRAAFRVRLARNEADYLNQISRAKLHVTGRFHSVCLSLITGTPFLALGSNSWKIEALLQEAGLDADRLVSMSQLAGLRAGDMDRPFSTQETQNIAAFLQKAADDGAQLFSDLAHLAQERRV